QRLLEAVQLRIDELDGAVVAGPHLLMGALLLLPELRLGAEVPAVLVEPGDPLPHGPPRELAAPVLVPQPLRRVEGGVGPVEGHVEEERPARVPPLEEAERLVGHPAGGVQALLALP